MTTTPTPPDHFPDATKMIAALEDDVKPIRDALAGVPRMAWALHGHNVIIPDTEEGNSEGLINFAAIFNKLVGKKFARYVAACNPARIARLLARIDAQALRLEAAERDAVRADVAMLRGSRKVLWNLLGECLPLLHQIERHDAESDERLGFLIGQIEAARSQVQAEELPGRI